jgi:hypothetical protein
MNKKFSTDKTFSRCDEQGEKKTRPMLFFSSFLSYLTRNNKLSLGCYEKKEEKKMSRLPFLSY